MNCFSLPLFRVSDLCRNVRERVEQECERYGITKPPLITARVTQTYDVGACVYFYLAFSYLSVNDPIGVFDAVEVGEW